MDKNVLVQRAALDVVTILFPFHQSFLLQPDLTSILTAALHTLLKRDVSLSRRLYVWLLGTQVLKSSLANCIQPSPSPSSSSEQPSNQESEGNSTQDLVYFERYSKAYLSLAFKGILVQAAEATRQNLPKVECVLPYRLLRALLDRSEVSASIMHSIMLDLVVCLRDQIEALGGVSTTPPGKGAEGSLAKLKGSMVVRDGSSSSKKPGKKGSLKAEVIQSANLLLGSLSQDFVWGWMADMLRQCLQSGGPKRRRRRRSDGGSASREEEREEEEEVRVSASGMLDCVKESPAGGDAPQSLDLKTLLALVMFLLHILPKVRPPSLPHSLPPSLPISPQDSVDSVHLWHVSQLLLQLVSLMRTHQPVFSLPELDLCHEVCLHLLNKLLQAQVSQPASLATTPITPATPSLQLPGQSLASVVTGPDSVCLEPEVLSLREMTVKIYDDFLCFFSEFVQERVMAGGVGDSTSSGELYGTFCSACQAVVVTNKLMHTSKMLEDSGSASDRGDAEKQTRPSAATLSPAPWPWLRDLMGVCQDGRRPSLTLVALETLLRLVEIVRQGATPTPARHGTHPPHDVQSRVLLASMVDSAILTQEFVKV